MKDILELSIREKYRHIWVLLALMIVPGFVILLPGGTGEAVTKHYRFKESPGGLINVDYFMGGTLGIVFLTYLIKALSTEGLVIM